MAPLDVGELHNFGYATKKKIESTFKTSTCGELVKVSRGALQACLGEKNGQTLYNFVRGIDPRPLTPHQERRSVSAEVNVSAGGVASVLARLKVHSRHRAVRHPFHHRRRGIQVPDRSFGRSRSPNESYRSSRSIGNVEGHGERSRSASGGTKGEMTYVQGVVMAC